VWCAWFVVYFFLSDLFICVVSWGLVVGGGSPGEEVGCVVRERGCVGGCGR